MFTHGIHSQHCRAWVTILVIATLALRGFIPVGYMPNSAPRAHQPFAMSMCSGMGPMVMDDRSHHADHAAPVNRPDSPKHHKQAPCPFSTGAMFAFGGVAPCCAVPFLVFITLSLLTAFALTRTRRFGNAAPRAPPVCFA